jgi:hypothetical protein
MKYSWLAHATLVNMAGGDGWLQNPWPCDHGSCANHRPDLVERLDGVDLAINADRFGVQVPLRVRLSIGSCTHRRCYAFFSVFSR